MAILAFGAMRTLVPLLINTYPRLTWSQHTLNGAQRTGDGYWKDLENRGRALKRQRQCCAPSIQFAPYQGHPLKCGIYSIFCILNKSFNGCPRKRENGPSPKLLRKPRYSARADLKNGGKTDSWAQQTRTQRNKITFLLPTRRQIM